MGIHLDSLTEEQRRVVTHGDGPAVVIACPGSGKTMALTHRIGHLIMNNGVAPESMLGITFTRAAAEEMKNRLAALIPPHRARGVRLYTFHGLAYRIVRELFGPPAVLDERRQRQMAGQLLREFQLNADQTAVDNLLTDFAFYVGAQVPLERFHPATGAADLFAQIWDRYRELKAEAGLMDFDDLIVKARDALRADPKEQARQAGRIRYLLVDEYQDTNQLQVELIDLLLPAGNQVMVVGDDDQAIYSFRGAAPRHMLTFPQRFAGCAELKLTQNFRSTASIVQPAGCLISVNRRRFAKQFGAQRPAAQDPVVIRPADAADEAETIAGAIRERVAAGVAPTDLAVLYRTHLTGFPLMDRLEKAGVPFRVLGGRPNPFTRWMARDVLAYLRWAHGEASPEEIIRVLRRPSRRGVPKELVAELERQKLAPDAMVGWLAARVSFGGQRDLETLQTDLKRLVETPAAQAISFIRGYIGYDDYIDQYCEWVGSDPQEAREVLTLIEQIPQPDAPSRIYLDLAAREENRQETDDPSVPSVTLASFHGSKGLEWPQVWLLSAVEGSIPHRTTIESGSDEGMEEERRLFYVGMTRAKDSLVVSVPRRLSQFEAVESRFVRESGLSEPPKPAQKPQRARRETGPASPAKAAQIEPSLPPALTEDRYVPGTRCFHRMFGPGEIRAVYPGKGKLAVYFAEVPGEKVLDIKTCLSYGLLREPRAG